MDYCGQENANVDDLIEIGTNSGDAWGVRTREVYLANGGGPSFAAGTPILTLEGSKSIEQFQIGDMVLSVPEGDPNGAALGSGAERH